MKFNKFVIDNFKGIKHTELNLKGFGDRFRLRRLCVDMAIKTKDIDLGYVKILREMKKLDQNPRVKVGWPAEDAKSVAPHSDSSLTVAQIAIIHEFGSPMKNIPERSMLRVTHDAKAKEWSKATDKLAGQIFDGKLTVEQALDKLGILMLRDVKRRISSGIPPALKYREGTPLVDTAQILNATTYVRIMGNE